VSDWLQTASVGVLRGGRRYSLGLSHDLTPLSLTQDIVEPQLGSRLTDVVDPSSDGDDVGRLISGLLDDLAVLLDVRGEGHRHMEFVGVRVRSREGSFRVGDGAELLDCSRSDLVVLLQGEASVTRLWESKGTRYVGSELLLSLSGVLGLGNNNRLVGILVDRRLVSSCPGCCRRLTHLLRLSCCPLSLFDTLLELTRG
jgi:hypothetical protein